MNIRTFNSNIPSLNAQRRLARVTSELDQSYQRLSSGLRINRASDDAAGLSVAKNLEADSRVYSQGVRNLNDAISYLDIADGAVSSLKLILFRSRELATQAANGSLGTSQRGALNKELVELSKEYNRIIQTTEFNGSTIFESQGTNPTTIQFGYGSNESLALETGAGPLQLGAEFGDISAAGASGNGTSGGGGLSGDGRYVVFNSLATNLVSGDTNGFEDVFVRDRLTGEVTLVSKGVGGAQSNSGSWESSISYDGRYVAYRSNASNLVNGDTNGAADVFVYDMATQTTERVSISSAGSQGNGIGIEPSISGDGRYVAFLSTSSNLVSGDTNAAGDIFVHDRLTHTTVRASVSSTGAQLALGGGGQVPKISNDGSMVLFTTASAVDGLDSNGASDVAVWRRSTGTSVTISLGTSGTTGNAGALEGRISADGTTAIFRSTSTDLVSGDTNGVSDVFARNLVTGVTTLESVADDGTLGNGNSFTAGLSADGRFAVIRSSATNLVTGDGNGVDDIFVRDIVARTTTRVTMSPTGVEANGSAVYAAISGDGQYISLASAATNMVAGDTNGATNVFIVRNTGISRAVGFSSVITPFVGVGIGDATQARMAQSTIDNYLSELNVSLGKLGATGSRARTALSAVQNRSDNLLDAASRIMDADVAEESSKLAARQVVQQSAQKVLVLANNDMQITRSLLGIG